MTLISRRSTQPSTRYPLETEYTYQVVLTHRFPQNTPLAIGDEALVGIWFSQT